MNEDAVKLHGSIALTARRLQASYEIENRSGEDIYVFDAMFRLVGGQPALDASLAYTVMEVDMLTLFRGVLRIPVGLQVEAPDVPFARLLPSGRTLTSTIDAPVPLPFHQPYEWHDREETLSMRRVRLRIGYAAAKDVVPRPAAKRVNEAVVYSVGYRQVIEVQHFLETPPQGGTVPVLVKP
jgi:hypothetical protein